MRILSQSECWGAAARMGDAISLEKQPHILFGIPRGGVPVSYLLAHRFQISDDNEEATIFVDDLIDSGRTRTRWGKYRPEVPFFALADYLREPNRQGDWLVFPWEVTEQGTSEKSAEDIVVRLLQYIGEDPGREGLLETPKRVLNAWKDWTAGYGVDPKSILKTFEDGSENYDEMIVVKDLPFFTHCEHHLAPFFGSITIGYVPNKRIVGLSKFSRLIEVFSRRLQVQERLTTQLAHALNDSLAPKGVGVLIKARHMCMESRGVKQRGETTTNALLGVFREGNVRQEFLSLTK